MGLKLTVCCYRLSPSLSIITSVMHRCTSCSNVFGTFILLFYVAIQDATKGNNLANATCQDVWTEYHDMGIPGIKAVADYKVYTAGSILDLLHYVAPKMMKRGDAHYSYGIADDLDDPKYNHYKYWSNPLETRYV